MLRDGSKPPQEDTQKVTKVKSPHAFGAQHRRRNKHGQLSLAMPSGLAKTCRDCGLTKPISDYYLETEGKRKGKPRFARCKKCYNCRRNEQHVRTNYSGLIKRKYGLTIEKYDAMRAEQDYRCAVCRRHEDELKQDPSLGRNRRLEVDHCHKKGHVRGLLCNACNLALGRLGDVPEAAFNAFQYLLYWTERENPLGRAA